MTRSVTQRHDLTTISDRNIWIFGQTILKCSWQAGPAVRGDIHLHRQPGQIHRDSGPGQPGGGEPDLHSHELLLVHPGGSPGPGGGHLAQVSQRNINHIH